MTGTRSESTINRRDQDWGETLDRLRGFVAARVEDPEVAADITQDVLVRTIASGALDRVDNLGAWLYRAARNAVIDHYRTRRIHEPDADLERWPDPDRTDNLPNDATRELARCLQPMLGRLHPSRTRRAHPRRPGRPDPPAGRGPARHLHLRDEVPGAARPPRPPEQVTSCCQVETDSTGALADYVPTRAAVVVSRNSACCVRCRRCARGVA